MVHHEHRNHDTALDETWSLCCGTAPAKENRTGLMLVLLMFLLHAFARGRGIIHTRKDAQEEPRLLLQHQSWALLFWGATLESSLSACPNAQRLFCVCLFNYRNSLSNH